MKAMADYPGRIDVNNQGTAFNQAAVQHIRTLNIS